MKILDYLRGKWLKKAAASEKRNAYSDDDMVFSGEGKSFIIFNKKTRKIRQFVSGDGWMFVTDSEIDFDAMRAGCPHFNGLKRADYYFGTYDRFINGICALVWTVYPDGRYFEDEDGFGAESNKEERAYCIINSDLKVLVPFQPMDDVKALLKKYREASF